MATGQALLDRMELVNQELQLQSGENDVARGLVALNVAQDYFESLAALRKGISSAPTTVSTTGSVEYTAVPTGQLRVDRLQLQDSSSGRPTVELTKLSRTGGASSMGVWPLQWISSTGSGSPSAYWSNGQRFYWQPLPSGTFTIRVYGFARAADITASGTFAYDDGVMFPLAGFAVRLMKVGVDDPANDVAALAQETFKNILDTLEEHTRDGSSDLEYTQIHRA